MKYNRERLSYLEGWISIISNILLFFLKFWAGIVSSSVAIISDAWHTLSDSISSIIVLIGAKAAAKPADREHPFGHGRFEIIASILIGFMLILIAINCAKSAVNSFNNRETSAFGILAIIVILISIVVKEVLARFAFWAAKKIDSKMLKADGWHHRSDALSSVVVLIGIFLSKYFWWIDSVLGFIIGIMIANAAIKIIRDAIDSLLGKQVSDELKFKVSEICNYVSRQDVHTHHFHIHNYGHHSELTFHINLPPNYSLKKAHKISIQIEKTIMERFNIFTTIHMEPKK